MTARLSSSDLAAAAARAAAEKLAIDVIVLDVAAIIGICDMFVIASGRNARHTKAIADEVEEQLWLLDDRKVDSSEGRDDSQWILLDYGDVVVHVFDAEQRSYYRIERLYEDAPQLDWESDRS